MLVAEIAEYLDGLGLVSFDAAGVNGNTFIETLPDTPDVAVGIFSSSGPAADVSTSVRRPGVQLLVRGDRDPRTAEAQAQLIWDALHGLHTTAFVVGGTRVMLCAGRQSAPIRLGPDVNGRHVYSLNFQLITGGA